MSQNKIDAAELNQKMTSDQLAGHLGIVFTEITQGTLSKDTTVSAQITISKIHSRPGGIMSGGTTLALIETVASVASMLTVDIKKQNVFGIEVNANHLAQVAMGETITAKATADHIGRTTQIWQVRIQNSNEKLVCVGRITIFVSDRN
jgi:1,4-dihydroxy-2-naphthoyl-CoA hydrolase